MITTDILRKLASRQQNLAIWRKLAASADDYDGRAGQRPHSNWFAEQMGKANPASKPKAAAPAAKPVASSPRPQNPTPAAAPPMVSQPAPSQISSTVEQTPDAGGK